MIKRTINKMRWLRYTKHTGEVWQQWDSLGGGKYAEEKIKPYQLLSRPSFDPLPSNDPIFSTPRYLLAGPRHNWSKSVEYVYHIQKSCYLEPEFGYLIMEPSILVPEALSWSNIAREKDSLAYFSGVPSVENYQEARQGKRPVRREPIIISLRHVFDANYAHCLIQLMPALMLLDECGISHDIPIVVSSKLGKTSFFKGMTESGYLRNRHWIVQDDSYIQADEVIFARTEWPSPALMKRFLDELNVTQGDPDSQKRLFIVRRTRQLENMDELFPILKTLNYEIVRPEELSFTQQIGLFSQASIVGGVLGAGLTNAIFRREAPLQLLEVCSRMENDPTFYALGKTCGYDYHSLVGDHYKNNNRNGSFLVEAAHFEKFFRDAINRSAGN